jgi:hypothetical protein
VVAGAIAAAVPARAQISRVGDTFNAMEVPARGTAVAFDPVNNVYVTVSAHGQVSARFISADGVPLGNPVVINGNVGNQFPSVAYSPHAGAFLVTWYSFGSVRVRMISYTGGVLGTETGVSPGDIIYEIMGAPVAYSTESQEFFVVFRSGTSFDIQGVRVGNNGQPIGAAFPINDPATKVIRNNPSVTYNPVRDEYLVLYV